MSDEVLDFLEGDGFLFISVMIIVLFMTVIICTIIKIKKDALKPMRSGKCKVIEKSADTDGIVKMENIVVQFTDGQRLRLKNYKSYKTTVAVGDEGIVFYKGTTMQSFSRE